MRIPFHLRRTPPHPADALLLPAENVAELLALCARLGGDRLPIIHAVAGGFLIKLFAPSDQPHPNTIRLRALARDLFIPADADLVPALLPDEALALVRQRGLVFLPGEQVLAFAPDQVLGAADLLAAPRLPRRPWRPLPPPPRRADRLHEVLLETPGLSVEGLLEAGGSGIGVEAPRPAGAGPAATAAGHTLAGVGRGLAWLGRHLGLDGLSRLGAHLIEQALRQAPRLGEALLGRQEAALRELLRRFREGDTEQALRHALPLGDRQARGHQPATNARLPTNDLRYSLEALLGGGQAGGGLWLSAGDVYDALAAEYGKAAEEATRRGDHRRAAFIYGMLLHDWRLAAAVLERGGLYRDAALLYLEKLGDEPAAARAFESAGEVDRALELYLARGEHVAAGDLLGRAGETDRALEQYRQAADGEAARGNHQAAGELLLGRAGRPDLAEAFFQAGWQQRPRGTAHGCLLRLLDLYAVRTTAGDLEALSGEAAAFFSHDGSDTQAAQFFNALARHAHSDHLTAVRDALRDQALLGLAGRLRQRGQAGQHGPAIVSGLFAPAGPWEPALLRDAEIALRAAAREQAGRGPRIRRVITHTAPLTALCAARQTGDLFLGFADGRVVRFDPRRGVSVELEHPGRVTALSVDDEARLLVVATQESNTCRVAGIRVDAGRPARCCRTDSRIGPVLHLTPVATSNDCFAVGAWDGDVMHYLTGTDLVPEAHVRGSIDLRMALLLAAPAADRLRLFVLQFEADRVALFVTPLAGAVVVTGAGEPAEQPQATLHLHWSLPEPTALAALPLSWLPLRGRYLELAGVTDAGALAWAQLRLFGGDAAVAVSQYTSAVPPFRTATLVRPGVVMGVQARGVFPYFVDEARLQPRPAVRADLADAVACCYSHPTGELLVVAANGDVVRIPLPA